MSETIIHPITYKILEVKDIQTKDHTGYFNDETEETKKIVEFTVIGKQSEWEDWLFFEDFKKANPKIKI